MDRRSFLRAGSLFSMAAAVAAHEPRTVYSFLTGRRPSLRGVDLAGRPVEIPFRNGEYVVPEFTVIRHQDLTLSGPVILSQGILIEECLIQPAYDYAGVLLDASRVRKSGQKEILISCCHILANGKECSIQG